MTTSNLADGQSDAILYPREHECPFHPPEKLGELRESQPISRAKLPDGHEGWLVTSHELCRAVLGDPRFTNLPGGLPQLEPARQAAIVRHAIAHEDAFPADIKSVVQSYEDDGKLVDAFRDPEVVRALHDHPLRRMPFVLMDDPGHAHIRRDVAGYFTVRRAAENREALAQIVDKCLDAMEEQGPPVDLVETFALAIPSLMTCLLFGVPESDRVHFEHAHAAARRLDATPDEVIETNEQFRAFIADLVENKRTNPGDDMISRLVQSSDMTEDELVSTAGLFVFAAHQTSASTFAFGVCALLEHRDQWDALRTGAVPVESVVEEILRFTTVSQSIDIRVALEDVDLGGTVVRANEMVIISLAAANRDPNVFPDPDRLDVSRHGAVRHVTFGYGPHVCIGQHFARVELGLGFAGLAKRFPNLELAVPFEELSWDNGDPNIYSPRTLPVKW